MQIEKIELKNNHIFGDRSICFYNDENSKINTISGKNGAGKTTVFLLAALIQKAYFCELLKAERNSLDYTEKVYKCVTDEIMHHMVRDNSSISLVLNIEKEDMKLVALKKAMNLWNKLAINDGIARIKLTLSVSNRTENNCKWELSITDEQKKLISYFWNLKNPINLIIYIPADKLVFEDDVKYEDVRLVSEKGLSKKLNILFDFNDIYNRLYSIILNDYIMQRINPKKGNASRDRYVGISKKIFENLITEINIGNISSSIKKNQFIITANRKDNPKHKYEVRDFSSGEKLIWYTSILLNYIKNIGILIIDEPENHLHEVLLWNFIQFLQEICTDYQNEITLTQVFLLTHSKNLIYNNFSQGKNYVIIDGNIEQLKYDDCEKLLRNIGVSCVAEKILFVEGNTDESTLAEVFSRHNIQIEVLGSCEQIIKAYEGVQKVSTHIQDKRFIFLLDRDTRDDEEIKRLRDENAGYFDEHVVFMERHELENYYLDEKVVFDTLNKICDAVGKSKISIEEVANIFKKNADETLDDTKKKYLNYLLHAKLHHMDSLFKKKDISYENEASYKNYISEVFNSQEWKKTKNSMYDFYKKMEMKYSKTEWDNNWKILCDGKAVFNKCLSDFKNISGVEVKTLNNKIINDCLKNKGSDLNSLVEKIINKYKEIVSS